MNMYNNMQYAYSNTTDYLFRFHNAQMVNEVSNGSLIKRFVKEHGMNIIFILHTTGFDLLQENEKKEVEMTGY